MLQCEHNSNFTWNQFLASLKMIKVTFSRISRSMWVAVKFPIFPNVNLTGFHVKNTGVLNHGVEKRNIYSHWEFSISLSKRTIYVPLNSNSQLTCPTLCILTQKIFCQINYWVNKNVAFTEFLPKKHESKFPTVIFTLWKLQQFMYSYQFFTKISWNQGYKDVIHTSQTPYFSIFFRIRKIVPIPFYTNLWILSKEKNRQIEKKAQSFIQSI